MNTFFLLVLTLRPQLREIINSNFSSPTWLTPALRERLWSVNRLLERARFTPACAGKKQPIFSYLIDGPRPLCGKKQPIFRVHSRVCGKDLDKSPFPIPLPGSLPRVRERLDNQSLRKRVSRFTPACAGKTFEKLVAPYHAWVHSRVCGKDEKEQKPLLTSLGSLPRVRERPKPLQSQS